MICEELIALIYGSLVTQTIKTSEHLTQANERLEKIGHRIGLKIVDEYMRESINTQPCKTYQQLVTRFCKQGIKKFLTTADSRQEDFKYTEKGFSFKLKIINNPLLIHLQIPNELKNGNLHYQSILKGAIRGSFEILKFKTTITILQENIKIDNNQTVFYIEARKCDEKE